MFPIFFEKGIVSEGRYILQELTIKNHFVLCVLMISKICCCLFVEKVFSAFAAILANPKSFNPF
jgi:hypothetical protein